MKFKSEQRIPKSKTTFSHAETFLSLGSCFADEIGGNLQDHLFDCCSNPLGTIYNPLAISELVKRAISGSSFRKSEFFQSHETWRHNLVHSAYSDIDLDSSVEIANTRLNQLQDYLRESDVVFLTLGSAWLYKPKSSSEIIGHNHRRPMAEFEKKLLDPSEVAAAIASAFNLLIKENPKVEICITVSPVKHIKDGLHENNLSKSSLLLAAQKLTSQYPNTCYFPAYEILVDELRDYRFYAEDLAHPNKLATRFIWDRFCETYFDDTTRDLVRQINSISNSLSHRPQHPQTQSYAQLKTKLRQDITRLEKMNIRVDQLLKRWKSLP